MKITEMYIGMPIGVYLGEFMGLSLGKVVDFDESNSGNLISVLELDVYREPVLISQNKCMAVKHLDSDKAHFKFIEPLNFDNISLGMDIEYFGEPSKIIGTHITSAGDKYITIKLKDGEEIKAFPHHCEPLGIDRNRFTKCYDLAGNQI